MPTAYKGKIRRKKDERKIVNMRIGLYGIRGVYNFGCEAIVRGAYNFVSTVYPGSEIVYFSYSPEYDSSALADIPIKIIPIRIKASMTKRIGNKILKALGANHRFFLFDVDEIISTVDVILSIGGDIYTIPKVLRNKQKYPFYNPLVDLCDRAIKKGKQVIVYGASVGPWGNYQKAINYNVEALRKYKVILCREEETVNYLKQLSIQNTCFFPDPAYQVKGHTETTNKKYIGINLSPLSLNEVFGNHGDNHISNLANLLDKLYEAHGSKLLFIPHVLSENEDDNDRWFMDKIKDKMLHKQYVEFAETSKGFIGLKNQIAMCHIVIAARMHCAVNAIVECVPTIFICYSQKGFGMCKYVYGNETMAVELQKINRDLLPLVERTLQNMDSLTTKLTRKNIEITSYYEENVLKVKRLITDTSSL